MLDNHTYNLMSQIVEEHKSLWRMKNDYSKDSESCPECQNIWNRMIVDKEQHIKDLLAVIKAHISS